MLDPSVAGLTYDVEMGLLFDEKGKPGWSPEPCISRLVPGAGPVSGLGKSISEIAESGTEYKGFSGFAEKGATPVVFDVRASCG